MKQLEVNPGNEKYYTKDFISGYRCGTKRQFESDLTILDKIRAEIENHCGLAKENHCKYCSYCNCVMGVREILEIIDKYRAESEDEE